MTDDELDRALLALPLDEPPAGLRERILAATVHRAAVATPAFRPWEIVLLIVAVLIVAGLTVAMLASIPDVGGRSETAVIGALRALGLFSVRTYAWLAVGASVVWTISSLPLMPVTARTVYNR